MGVGILAADTVLNVQRNDYSVVVRADGKLLVCGCAGEERNCASVFGLVFGAGVLALL